MYLSICPGDCHWDRKLWEIQNCTVVTEISSHFLHNTFIRVHLVIHSMATNSVPIMLAFFKVRQICSIICYGKSCRKDRTIVLGFIRPPVLISKWPGSRTKELHNWIGLLCLELVFVLLDAVISWPYTQRLFLFSLWAWMDEFPTVPIVNQKMRGRWGPTAHQEPVKICIVYVFIFECPVPPFSASNPLLPLTNVTNVKLKLFKKFWKTANFTSVFLNKAGKSVFKRRKKKTWRTKFQKNRESSNTL